MLQWRSYRAKVRRRLNRGPVERKTSFRGITTKLLLFYVMKQGVPFLIDNNSGSSIIPSLFICLYLFHF